MHLHRTTNGECPAESDAWSLYFPSFRMNVAVGECFFLSIYWTKVHFNEERSRCSWEGPTNLASFWSSFLTKENLYTSWKPFYKPQPMWSCVWFNFKLLTFLILTQSHRLEIARLLHQLKVELLLKVPWTTLKVALWCALLIWATNGDITPSC